MRAWDASGNRIRSNRGRCYLTTLLQILQQILILVKQLFTSLYTPAGTDLLLRQCLKLRSHYTTGSESIYINNYVFLVTCQGILMKTIYLLSQKPLLLKLLCTTGHNGLSQPPMTLVRSDIIDA